MDWHAENFLTPIDIGSFVILMGLGTWKLYDLTSLAANWSSKRIIQWVEKMSRPK